MLLYIKDFICVTLILTLYIAVFDCYAVENNTRKRSKRNHLDCRPKSLVKYILTVHTEWSKQTFPRMFPTYRPNAQWSSLVGRTHGPEYKMWEVGTNATLAAKLFAEKGEYHELDNESSQGFNDILDNFVAQPIAAGVGQTSTVIFLDGQHSKVSFMMKIIPSPDWFIGVSNLDLCARGRWKRKMHTDLYPFDAGIDQGLTFTSPNWPNAPAVPISSITSTFPNHSASSFLYPEYKKLPRLAYLDLHIVEEYKKGHTFMQVPTYSSTSKGNMDDHYEMQDEGHKMSAFARSETTTHKSRVINLDNAVLDCRVGEWSGWSACSQTCGLGQQERSRGVSSYPKNGGANCPRLRETNVCGSARDCQFPRFTFLERNTTRKQLREVKPNRQRASARKSSVGSFKSLT